MPKERVEPPVPEFPAEVRGMTWVQSNRNITLNTLKGHTIFFLSGRKQLCPNIVLEDAMAIGIIPVDQKNLPSEDDSILPVEITGSARVNQIRDVLEALIRRNGRNDFTASGLPNLKVVNRTLGYDIDLTEMTKVWAAIEKAKADARHDPAQAIENAAPVRPSDPEEFAAALDEVVRSVFETGAEEDFTGAGAPQVRSIVNRTGYDVTAAERDAAHERYARAQKGQPAE